jgi:hypothetical protein
MGGKFGLGLLEGGLQVDRMDRRIPDVKVVPGSRAKDASGPAHGVHNSYQQSTSRNPRHHAFLKRVAAVRHPLARRTTALVGGRSSDSWLGRHLRLATYFGSSREAIRRCRRCAAGPSTSAFRTTPWPAYSTCRTMIGSGGAVVLPHLLPNLFSRAIPVSGGSVREGRPPGQTSTPTRTSPLITASWV